MIYSPLQLRTVWLLAFCILSCASGEAIATYQADDPESVTADASESDRIGYLVRVPLPIDSKVSAEVRQSLKRLSEKSQLAVRPENRPVVVLEFDTAGGKSGRGSELESCWALARYLGSPDLNRLQTVAYIPSARGLVEQQNEGGPTGQLQGHAVLVAIAANQIAMAPGTTIGAAGIDETRIDVPMREIYRSVASQRLALPVPVVLSMLDPQLQLFRVTTAKRGVVYVDDIELKELEAASDAAGTVTISKPGELAELDSQQLIDYRLIRLNPENPTGLARMLDLAPNSLEGNPTEGKPWQAIQMDLPPQLDVKSAQWIIQAISREVSQNDVNLIILNIEDNQGNLDACVRLSQHLLSYDPGKVRTVAFVRESARGPIGLVALNCDHLIMDPNAILGGEDPETDSALSETELEEVQPLVVELAKTKQSDWSIMMAMLNPKLTVSRFRQKQSGQIRLLSNAELESLADLEDWAPLGPVSVTTGIDATTAEQLFLARTIAEDMGQVQTFYQLDGSPRIVRPSVTDKWVDQMAGFLATPFVAMLLLFAAMFFFSTEMSAPGLGLPGFLATVCFVLFFWSQSLGGNADWLEIILFVVGTIFILLEIFVLPGFGIFGVGGLLMVVVSVVLASQSFLIPRTTEELAQIPYSLLPVIGAGFGVIVGAYAIRKILPNSPYLRRMLLEPPLRIDTGLDGQKDPEAIVDWSHLAGMSGETITRLFPAGKARIAGRVYDVIANGQMVDKGEKIVVMEAKGNRVVVRPASQSGNDVG